MSPQDLSPRPGPPLRLPAPNSLRMHQGRAKDRDADLPSPVCLGDPDAWGEGDLQTELGLQFPPQSRLDLSPEHYGKSQHRLKLAKERISRGGRRSREWLCTCVCLHVCTHTHTRVCLYACTCACTHTHVCILHVCSRMDAHRCVPACVHVCVYICTCLHACARACMHTCTHACTLTCTHVWAVHVCIHTCVPACVPMRACTHVCRQPCTHGYIHAHMCLHMSACACAHTCA